MKESLLVLESLRAYLTIKRIGKDRSSVSAALDKIRDLSEEKRIKWMKKPHSLDGLSKVERTRRSTVNGSKPVRKERRRTDNVSEGKGHSDLEDGLKIINKQQMELERKGNHLKR